MLADTIETPGAYHIGMEVHAVHERAEGCLTLLKFVRKRGVLSLSRLGAGGKEVILGSGRVILRAFFVNRRGDAFMRDYEARELVNAGTGLLAMNRELLLAVTSERPDFVVCSPEEVRVEWAVWVHKNEERLHLELPACSIGLADAKAADEEEVKSAARKVQDMMERTIGREKRSDEYGSRRLQQMEEAVERFRAEVNAAESDVLELQQHAEPGGSHDAELSLAILAKEMAAARLASAEKYLPKRREADKRNKARRAKLVASAEEKLARAGRILAGAAE
jgi:hypothetical protein